MEPTALDLKIVEVVSLVEVNNRQHAVPVPEATDKPLLMLIKRLVDFVDNEEKTMLTNSQLMNILHKEFDIDVWKLPTLAVDIYMSVLKKFLKTWPRWDTVESTVHCAEVDKTIDIESVLLKECEGLKVYLKEMLDLSREPIATALTKVNSTTVATKEEAVLEVTCTREQLNKLIFRQPDPSCDMTIFNCQTMPTKAKICANTMDLSQLCYWPSFSIEIDVAKSFQYTRKNDFDLSHTLVNHKLGQPPRPPPINRYILSRKKSDSSFQAYYTLSNFVDSLLTNLENDVKIPKQTEKRKAYAAMLKIILEMVKRDLTHCPCPVDVNSEYMYFLNAHPYTRHLFRNIVPSGHITDEKKLEMDKYDLEIHEYICPKVIFSISVSPSVRLDGTLPHMSEENIVKLMLEDKEHWVRFLCINCDAVFTGLHSVRAMLSHFRETHCNEPAAACSRCRKVFSVPDLTTIRWFHKC